MSYVSDALIDAQKREVKQLKDENGELKKRLAQYELFRDVVGDPAHEFASLRRMLHRVEHENAKLRELVRDIYVQYDGILDWVEIERRMGELGIEVK